MARVIKTIEEVLKLTGLDLGRYVKWLQKESKRFLEYERAGKLTPARKKKLDEIGDQLSKIKGRTPAKSKSETKGVPKRKKGKDYTPTPAQAKYIKELKEKAAKTGGTPTTSEQRAQINKYLTPENVKRTKKVKGKGDGDNRTRIPTDAGQKLLDKNTPASLEIFWRNRKLYTRAGGRQALKPKTIIRPEKEPVDYTPKKEQIEEFMQGEIPPGTSSQIRSMMGGKETGASEAEIIREIKELGGFEIFNKGGYKKFQSHSNLGRVVGAEGGLKKHVYMGKGSASDIPHFRKKKK